MTEHAEPETASLLVHSTSDKEVQRHAAVPCPCLQGYHLYGWNPDPSLSNHENYMDLVFIITRNAARQIEGHCGALLVDPRKMHRNGKEPQDTKANDDFERRFYGSIIGAATNQPLFCEKDSDIHAEIACLAQACRSCCSTANCTVYITIPPCKRCFAALVTFGIQRIVSRQPPPPLILETAQQRGIEVNCLTQIQNRAQMKRINELVNGAKSDEELMQYAEQRKQWRDAKRAARKQKEHSQKSS